MSSTNVIHLTSMVEYPRVARFVRDNGRRRSPRGIATYDVGHTTIILESIENAMPMGMGRGLDPAIGAVEAIQLIAGRSDEKLVLKIAPQFSQYVDGGRFHGAYGRRIGSQMMMVERRLRADHATRQAVVTLWDPRVDTFDGMKDYPCTVALGFSVNTDQRSKRLDMDVLMRSNDVWRGLTYDVFQFTQLQATLARSLGVPTGQYRHTTWSLHLYETDERDVDRLRLTTRYDESSQPDGIGHPEMSMLQMRRRATLIMDGTEPDDCTFDERWYLDRLHGRQSSDVG
jgi:thymidylate synthase